MTVEDIKGALGVLELRERLIFKLGVFAALRPGEIFGLRRSRLSVDTADIQERIYRTGSRNPGNGFCELRRQNCGRLFYGCSQVIEWKEREMGIEPTTSSLGSWHSTAELLPLVLFSAT